MLRASSVVSMNLLDPRGESLPPPPPPKQDLSSRLDGVIVLVSARDVYLAKACCASIRQAMGDIPITLLVDGREVNTAELSRLSNVKIMVAQEVAGEYERFLTSFWVKLLVFWASPYERFLYLDADTLVWGDVRVYAEFDKYDFIAGYHFKNPRVAQKPEDCPFDREVIKKLDPALVWRGQIDANNGVFFARRGVFTRKDLIALRKLECWRNYENGLVNYFRWHAAGAGLPRTSGHEIQLFPANSSMPDEDRFLPRDCRRPAIIHWISKKPRLGRRYRAADDYRKLFLKMTGRTKWLNARLFIEDIAVWLGRQKRSLLRQKRRSESAPVLPVLPVESEA
jgi:hypothetical protein